MTQARGLRDGGGRALRDAAGRARTRACPGTCCSGGGGECRYYTAVLCSTWLCEPGIMASILPGAGDTIYLCICPPQPAPIGQVFRIETRCYRITGPGVSRDVVPDSAWLYECTGELIPPVGSPLGTSRHQMIAEAGCESLSCRVNLCSRWVQLTPCGGAAGCPRPVFARADQYAYGRAIPVVCTGGTTAVCYCAQATPDVLDFSQLPPVRQVVTTPAVNGDCCVCVGAIGGSAATCSAALVPGSGDSRGRVCCCPSGSAITGFTASMRATAGSLVLEWVDVTRIPEFGRVVRLSVYLRITDTSSGRTGRYGPYEIAIGCGVGVDPTQIQSFRAEHDETATEGLGWAFTDGWLDFFGARYLDVIGFGSRFPATDVGWTRSETGTCTRLAIDDANTPLGIANVLNVEMIGQTDQCEGCGSGSGPGSGDIGGLIP